MKRAYLKFIGLMSFVLLAACGALLFTAPEQAPWLSVCVDWLTGFTQHSEGLPGGIAVAVANTGALAATKQKGQRAEDAPGPSITLTDEQFERLLNPTDDEVDEAAERLASQQRGQQQTTLPQLDPNKEQRAAVNENGVLVGFDRGNHWKRRAVRYIQAQMLAGSGRMEGREAAVQIVRGLTQHTLDQTPAQYQAEHREALDIIEASGLDARAKRRVRDLIGAYDEDLQALRAVPAEKRALEGHSPLQAETQKRTHSTLSDTAGGYLLPKPFLAELFVIVEEYGVVRRIFRTIAMTSKTLDWKDIGSKPTAAWYGELDLIAASDMTFGQGGLEAAKLAGITSLSTELDEDSMVALLPVYLRLMGEAIAEKEDLAGIKGDGSSAYGGQRGVLTLTGSGEASVYTMSSGNTSRDDFDIEEAIAMKNTLSKARRKNAKWLLSESVVTALITLKRNNEANNYVILDPNNNTGIARFLGYPLVDPEGVEDAFFPSDGTSTIFGAFGDFMRSIFGQRRGLTVETSREGILSNSSGAVTLNAFQQDAMIVKVTERVAIGHPQPDCYVLGKTAAS